MLGRQGFHLFLLCSSSIVSWGDFDCISNIQVIMEIDGSTSRIIIPSDTKFKSTRGSGYNRVGARHVSIWAKLDSHKGKLTKLRVLVLFLRFEDERFDPRSQFRFAGQLVRSPDDRDSITFKATTHILSTVIESVLKYPYHLFRQGRE